MWDNARLLNGNADLLLACAAAMLLFAAGRLALQSAPLQLREVTVLGPIALADRDQIGAAARSALQGRTFLMADLDHLRRTLEQVPWVRRVQVRRLWPVCAGAAWPVTERRGAEWTRSRSVLPTSSPRSATAR